MGNHNSQVRFAETLFEALFSDIAAGRPSHIGQSCKRDLETIRHRIRHEGLSFITITLPSLSKAIYQSFRTGKLVTPMGFSHAKGTSLPSFMIGLMKSVYDPDGLLREDADIPTLCEIIQISELAYKLKLPFRKQDVSKILDNFVKTDAECASFTKVIQDQDDPILKLAETIMGKLLRDYDPKSLVPRHGPGSVATREKGLRKWSFSRKILKLHAEFPYFEFFTTRRGLLSRSGVAWYRSLIPVEQSVAKVTLVPKDSRGPRLISMEPLEMQYIQQAVMKHLYEIVESHPLSRRRVNFTDQNPNRDHAKLGSYFDTWATLDMKDASDRVSLDLVKRLFSKAPIVLRHLLACRSDATELPDGRVVEFHKFAPMGSAVCFPVEALVHYVLCLASIIHRSNGVWGLREAIDKVLVYGDDLIITPAYAPLVMNDLERYGLLFNRSKSFINGPFRESCGINAFKGIDITPTRWREPWATKLTAASVRAFLDFAQSLYRSGYCRAAELVWKRCESVLKRRLPTTPLSMEAGFLTRWSRLPYLHTPYQVRRNSSLQRLEHKVVFLESKLSKNELTGGPRLLSSLVLGVRAQEAICNRSGVPVLRYKNGWTPVLQKHRWDLGG